MIKLIVSDLDGTLLDHHKKVTERELNALRQAKEAGITLCLASGRMNMEMQKVLQDIQHQGHSVSQNGAFIHLVDGTLLQAKLFEPSIAHQVFQKLKAYDVVKLICTGDANIIESISPASDEIQARMFEPFLLKSEIEQSLKDAFPICKFSLFGRVDVLLEIKKVLENELPDQLDIYLADKDCLDIMPHQVSKGTSILTLIAHLGFKPEEVACFGDSFNDVSMFGITPHSFAMHTAHADVKKQAAYTVNSVSEAIAHVFAFNEKKTTEHKGSTVR
ncbi:HAD family hydrolase [Paenibacillus qinlingensis]|uniref:Cof subfamily protein (Haloacid dehalogenase superfamily) n=1 Tax=Paenibacillus qinlingensis TaxID=1837343 RepID=A0ABU1P6T7_9BACL|nr:HAD family hydrolase [Paenibacillus qinlingensis]MDR6554882.1 Cof subfamily protein (haloacid dehalogenase superfamily) [Paenibacillus qinlingensis]